MMDSTPLLAITGQVGSHVLGKDAFQETDITGITMRNDGGASSGEFALEVPLKAAFFNDAGGGKDGAGIAALAMLQARGVAGGTVAHTSARIGDSLDTWECGVISDLNESARRLGLAVGESLRGALQRLVAG